MPIVVITLLGALARFVLIGHQGFWFDESYTAYLVRFDPGQMLRLVSITESTPPLYYCIAWVWTRVFGDDPAGLRSLSALAGTLTIPVTYLTARKLLANRRAAIIAAALVAFNPLLIWYSQEARAYEMMVLACALTLLAFVYARERPSRPALTAWAVASAVALATHYYAILAVAPQAAWLIYAHRRVRAVQIAIGAVVAVGLALLPLLIAQSGTGNDSWIATTSILTRLAQVIPLFLIGPETHLRTLVKYLAYAAALTGIGAFIWLADRDQQRAALVPGLIAAAGFLIAITIGEQTFLTRNLLPILVPLAILLAAGLGARTAGFIPVTATLVLCAIGVFATISVDTDYWLERPNWQVLANKLGRWPQSPAQHDAARIVVVQRGAGILPLKLYLPRLNYITTAQVSDVKEVDVIAVARKPGLGGFCWWGSACNLVPSKLDRHYRLRGFRLSRLMRVEQFRVMVLRARHPVTVRVSELPRRHVRSHNTSTNATKPGAQYFIQLG
ncbi:MAG: glycosyltransferase family 39 protein [Solirubrobacteraceae bacterium]